MPEPLPRAYQKHLDAMRILSSMQPQPYLLQLVLDACWVPGSLTP